MEIGPGSAARYRAFFFAEDVGGGVFHFNDCAESRAQRMTTLGNKPR